MFRKIRGSAVYQAQLKKYKEFPKILVSALYDKRTDEMQALEKENLDFKTAYLTPPLTDGFSDEGRLNYLKIQLDKIIRQSIK